jgi:hypothetical protein
MRCKSSSCSSCRPGADPPKNESGGHHHLATKSINSSMLGTTPASLPKTFSHCELVTSQKEISQIALILQGIPHSGYISPKAMARCLSAFKLTRLEGLSLRFEFPLSRPDRESRRTPPSTRSALPALTYFRLKRSVNTRRLLWPGSMPLYSTGCE